MTSCNIVRRIDSGALSVTKFVDGSCAITLAGQAMHLRPDEATRLVSILDRQFVEFTLGEA